MSPQTLVIAAARQLFACASACHFGPNGDARTLRTSSKLGSRSDMRGHHRKFGRRAVFLTLTLILVASCSPPVPNPPESAKVSPPPPTATSSADSEPKAAKGPGRTITVKAGQSLGGIAKTYHVSKQALIAANHLHPPYELTIGARLIVPASTVAPARGTKPHGAQGSTKPSHAAKPSEPPEVIPLD
jgi:LysM repeat protein